jgi:hypothetical protein
MLAMSEPMLKDTVEVNSPWDELQGSWFIIIDKLIRVETPKTRQPTLESTNAMNWNLGIS